MQRLLILGAQGLFSTKQSMDPTLRCFCGPSQCSLLWPMMLSNACTRLHGPPRPVPLSLSALSSHQQPLRHGFSSLKGSHSCWRVAHIARACWTPFITIFISIHILGDKVCMSITIWAVHVVTGAFLAAKGTILSASMPQAISARLYKGTWVASH